MTISEAVEPAPNPGNFEIPAEKIIESLQRQIGQNAAGFSFAQAKYEAIIEQLTVELKSARNLIDELLKMNSSAVSPNGMEDPADDQG
jgi:hypothetical protein